MEIDDLTERIVNTLDPDQLIDILGLTTEELCAILRYEIDENKDKFYFLTEED